MKPKSIVVGSPNIGNQKRFLGRVRDILSSRWLSNNGRYVIEFEKRISEITGTEHCIAVCNATAGIQIAVQALELTGEVILPSYTFIATAHALQWQGLKPTFAEINPTTHNLSPEAAARAITSKTSAILGVHLWGRPCETEAIEALAQAHGLKVLYDAAHAFGCTHLGRPVGGFGSCEVFSFHATKFINSLEGGAVTTNDPKLAEKLRLIRNFGFTDYDRVEALGINAKMNEVCAAMGISNLESIEEIIAINRRNYDLYCEGLGGVGGVSVLPYDLTERNNFQYVVLEVEPDVCSKSRDEVVQALHEEGIIARKYFWPGCHRMAPYRNSHELPVTEVVAARVVVLPTGQAVSKKCIRRICGVIRQNCKSLTGRNT
ncbi:MAG: DegT/DnrJ/EryC1/StrS family aminotransferase [Verrucomicrobia bacterium]|nr:DegT/DnrJ/EryC1/StrS family aminotransferase [Verrucomicrobiota bacterium]